jgi:predicted  nucleic acid-binding Zn-ribbon protein
VEEVQKELNKLLELQNIDLRIKALDEQSTDGYAKLDVDQEGIDACLAEAEDLKERLEVVGKEKRDVEIELEDEVNRLKDRQTKLMNVQTNREYQSLLKEIEHTKGDNKRRAEEIERYAEIAEAMEQKINDLETEADESGIVLAAEKAEVDKLTKELEKKKAKIDKTRGAKVKKVSKSTYKRYEQLRERRNGIAIVGVTDGVCQGCYMNIPPQQFNEVLKGDQMHTCPTCQRMLYHLPASEEE